MTSPEPMTRQELLELAALDALGLLDRYEAALYTRSFHHASAPVQDEIVRLQAEIASDETLLPVDEPDGSLRERVLRKVAEAIEAEASEFAPLATIGRRRRGSNESDGRSTFGTSGPFWRAAAFILAGTVVVLAYFWSDATKAHNELAMVALSSLTDGQLTQMIGPDITSFMFDDNVQRIVLKSDNPNASLEAVLFINPETGTAFLVTNNFPQSLEPTFSVNITTTGEQPEPLLAFMNISGLGGFRLDSLKYAANALTSATWTITEISSGTVLLTSI